MNNYLFSVLLSLIALIICCATLRWVRLNAQERRKKQQLLDDERRQWVRYTVYFEDGSYASGRRRRAPEDDLSREWPEFTPSPNETQK